MGDSRLRRVQTAMFTIITLCLVLEAGVGVMGSAMAPMANTITAPITLDPACEWDFGTYGLEVIEKVKRTIQNGYDCYKYCDEDQSCEWFSFRDAKWAKRKMCVLYEVNYKFRGIVTSGCRDRPVPILVILPEKG